MTSAPSLNRLSTVRETSSSLPGIGVADITTVSPSFTATCRWSPRAIRESALVGAPGQLGAGRVRQQEENTLRGDGGEACEVSLPTVDRGVVELPIARVHDGPVRGVDGHADRVGDAVADVVGVAAEIADAEWSPRRDLAERRALREFVLFQLRADEPDGELGAVDRDVEEVA